MVPGTFNNLRHARNIEAGGAAVTFGSGSSPVVPTITFGPAFRKRALLGVSWSAGTNRELNAVTADGQACARLGRAINIAAGSNFEWWSVDALAAATGLVALTFSGSVDAGDVLPYWTDPLASPVVNVGQFSDVASGTDLSTTLDTFSGGLLLAGMRAGSSQTIAWTGANAVTTGSAFQHVARQRETIKETAKSVAATLGGAAASRRMCVLAIQ